MQTDIPKEVLVVEDEALVRIVLADAMADNGIMAWEAGDATEALQVLNDHPRIGLIFTDVNMPGDMDGLALAREVSSARPDVGLIVTSGARTPGGEELPERATFLPKPYCAEQLVDMVQQRLDSPQE